MPVDMTKMCVNRYLFEDLATRLGFILFTQNCSCSQRLQPTKALHRMIEQFVQRVFSGEVHQGQGVETVHGAIRTLYLTFGGFGLEPLGQGTLLLGSR